MTSVNGYPRGKLIKKLTELGPYIREEQCQDFHFFFDCLAVCVNTKPAPEKREFWGWWLELDAQEEQWVYLYKFGLFDKQGQWKETPSGSLEVDEAVEKTLQDFFSRLKALLITLNIEMVPSEKQSEKTKTRIADI